VEESWSSFSSSEVISGWSSLAKKEKSKHSKKKIFFAEINARFLLLESSHLFFPQEK